MFVRSRSRLRASPAADARAEEEVHQFADEAARPVHDLADALIGLVVAPLLLLLALDAAGAHPREDARQFLGVEPDAVVAAEVDDDAAVARVVAPVHESA